MMVIRGVPTFVVEPHRGVAPVHFGMARADVQRAMPGGGVAFRTSPDAPDETDAWHGNGFQVSYRGRDPTVEFIELWADPAYAVTYKGVDVFSTPAEELVSIVAADALFDASDPELGYSYVFPSLDLALWRPVRERRNFSTIGVGVAGYFRSGPSGSVHQAPG
jgi:hypothetical protein